jgi:hypothetical protein
MAEHQGEFQCGRNMTLGRILEADDLPSFIYQRFLNCIYYIASNVRVILNGNWSWPVSKKYPSICLERLRKTTKNFRTASLRTRR